MKTWFISDPHFGHANILKFKRDDGSNLRCFDSIEEHDEVIAANWSALVKPEDRIYVMGDVCMSRKSIHILGKLPGRKKLIKGNHDIFKLKDYTAYFDDIVAMRVYPALGLLVTHVPVHPSNLEWRFSYNPHGHTHANLVKDAHGVPDPRYLNLCVEYTNYCPVELDAVVATLQHKNQK